MAATGSRGSGRLKDGRTGDGGRGATPGADPAPYRGPRPGRCPGPGLAGAGTARRRLGGTLGGRAHGAADFLDRHAQPAGQFPGVGGADAGVADLGDHRRGFPQGGDPALDGVQVVPLQGGADGEFKQRAPGADQVPDGGVALGLAQLAGVGAGGLHGHVGLRHEALVLLEGPQGRLLAGGVAVEGEDDLAAAAVVGEQAAGDLDVLGAERRAAGGDRRRDPGEVAGHHVGVALHHDELAVLGDVALGEVDPVEDLGLLVERGLRGVEVLGALVVLVELAGAEADGVPRDVPDGPDQPAAEAVVDPPAAFGEHPRQFQLGIGVAPAAEVLEQGVPALRGVADAELVGRGAVEAAVVQEVAALGGAGVSSWARKNSSATLWASSRRCRRPTSSRFGPEPPSS